MPRKKSKSLKQISADDERRLDAKRRKVAELDSLTKLKKSGQNKPSHSTEAEIEVGYREGPNVARATAIREHCVQLDKEHLTPEGRSTLKEIRDLARQIEDEKLLDMHQVATELQSSLTWATKLAGQSRLGFQVAKRYLCWCSDLIRFQNLERRPGKRIKRN